MINTMVLLINKERFPGEVNNCNQENFLFIKYFIFHRAILKGKINFAAGYKPNDYSMTGYNKSLLFYEDKLDLKHLRTILDKYEFESNYTGDRNTFVDECASRKYDLLIVSGVESDDASLSLVESLYLSKNPDTPIMLILDNNRIPPVDDMLKQEIFVITFPFTPEEFVFRAFSILRTAEMTKNIHLNLKSYKSLFDILPVGLIQTDERGKFLRTNPRFRSIINMDEKELAGENFFQLCNPDDYFLERKQLDRLLRKEQKCVDYEIRLINNEGKTLVCGIEATVIWNAEDVFESYTFVVRLIS